MFKPGHIMPKGPDSYGWKGGLWSNKEYRNERQREYRHKLGMSKQHIWSIRFL